MRLVVSMAMLAATASGVVHPWSDSHGKALSRPLQKSFRLTGSLLGVPMSKDGSVGQPFQLPVNIKPGNFPWYDKVNGGDVHFAEGMFDRALVAYEEALSTDGLPKGREPVVLLAIARALAANNRAFEARKVVQLAIAKIKSVDDKDYDGNPKKSTRDTTALLWFSYGLFSAMSGYWDDSQRAYLMVLDIIPGHSDSLNHLAMVSLIQGDLASFKRYFFRFINVLMNASVERQRSLFGEVLQERQSSFDESKIPRDAAKWLLDHAMLSLDIDGAPSMLQAAALESTIDSSVRFERIPEGYLPGELEANLLVVYECYSEHGFKNGQEVLFLDREIFHYNLGSRLEAIGVWEHARWQFGYAAQVGSPTRREFHRLRKEMQYPLAVTKNENEYEAEKAHSPDQRKLKLERLARDARRSSVAPATRQHVCSTLGSDLFRRRSLVLQPLDSKFRQATFEVCGISDQGLSIDSEEEASCESDSGGGNTESEYAPCIAVVAAHLHNSTSGKLLAPILRAFEAGQRYKVKYFTWPRMKHYSLIVPESSIHWLDPLGDLMVWQREIREPKCRQALVVDAHLDFRLYLLGQSSRLAPHQVQVVLDRFQQQIYTEPKFVDETMRLIPLRVAANHEERRELAKAYVLMVLRGILSMEKEINSVWHSPVVGGQYFFEKNRYYLVATMPHELHPDFDFVVQNILELDAQAIIVLFSENENAVGINLLWRRLESNPGIDISRIKMIEQSSRADWFTVLKNVDVMLEPWPPVGATTPASLIIEALLFRVPVVGVGSLLQNPFRANGACTFICPSFGVEDMCLVATLDAKVFAERALLLAGVGNTDSRTAYLLRLGAALKEDALADAFSFGAKMLTQYVDKWIS